MYWDVIEVKPKPDYKLFVRFEDGLDGDFQLVPKQLTGALAPLLDLKFFERVFIDSGAVAWPGEIDLAPDEMYGQIAASRLPRLQELRRLITDPDNPDAYFRDFENHLKDQTCRRTYDSWESELRQLDRIAWAALKAKAKDYLLKHDRRGWQQLFDTLGEAFAYNYLRTSEGCSRVSFIPESDIPTPDLEGLRDTERVLCEVKTINVSDDELHDRGKAGSVRDVADQLDAGFFRKLDCDISNAKKQIESYDPQGNAFHLVYFNVCFDDWLGHYREESLTQIEQHLKNQAPRVRVVLNVNAPYEPTRTVVQD